MKVARPIDAPRIVRSTVLGRFSARVTLLAVLAAGLSLGVSAEARTASACSPEPPPALLAVAAPDLQALYDAYRLAIEALAAQRALVMQLVAKSEQIGKYLTYLQRSGAPAKVISKWQTEFLLSVLEAQAAKDYLAKLVVGATAAETALTTATVATGVTAVELACWGIGGAGAAIGGGALIYECVDIYQSGSTFVTTGGGTWSEFLWETATGAFQRICYPKPYKWGWNAAKTGMVY